MMSGKSNDHDETLKLLFDKQKEFQSKVIEKFGYFGDKSLKIDDNPILFSYHIQQLMSEIGEVLSADKRWKSHRNEVIDMQNKKEEIADCFIVLMNVAMFSGMSADELFKNILNKIHENFERIK